MRNFPIMRLRNELSKAVCVIICVTIFASGCTSKSQPPKGQSPSNVTARLIVPQGKISFTSSTHGFSVWLPTKPKHSQKKVTSYNGVHRTQFLFISSANSVNYSVSVSPLALPSTQWESTLGELQQGMVLIRHAQLQHSEKIQLAGLPGRDIEFSLDYGGVIFRSRLYVTPQGAYAVAAGGYRVAMQQHRRQIDRVFDSFRFSQKSR